MFHPKEKRNTQIGHRPNSQLNKNRIKKKKKLPITLLLLEDMWKTLDDGSSVSSDKEYLHA